MPDSLVRKTPQDSDREEQLIAMCGLQAGCKNRIGVDAYDEYNDAYELKSTTKAGVSTARDVGLPHLTKWRTRNWICAKGLYDASGTFIFDEIYFLRPWNLEGWFRQIEEKLCARTPLFDKVLGFLTESKSFTRIDLEHIQRVFKRGVLMNDPNIPWSFIRTNGINITANPQKILREILQSSGPLVSVALPLDPTLRATLGHLFDN